MAALAGGPGGAVGLVLRRRLGGGGVGGGLVDGVTSMDMHWWADDRDAAAMAVDVLGPEVAAEILRCEISQPHVDERVRELLRDLARG